MVAKEKQAIIIHNACKKAGVDSHVKWIFRKNDARTMAEQIANQFKDVNAKDKSFPVKNSYMYCDALDLCFFFNKRNKACFSFSGFSFSGSDDLRKKRLVEAFKKAELIVDYMQEMMDDELLKEGKI